MSASAAPGALQPQHQRLIDESAIAPEVALERGYRTATTRAELKRLGFSETQARVPALLVPLYGPTGEPAGYQIRPDQPRLDKRGKVVKYETPRGMRMVLDVPKACTANKWLGDPTVPLFVTEGVRKADAGVSAGLCVVALLGVWNWRGRNDEDGLVALADWESVALKGRHVYIVFDSDVMTKTAVYAALERFKAFLERRGATTWIIYLPTGEAGRKVGLDDYLAAGGTRENLLRLACADLVGTNGMEPAPSFATTSDGRTIYYKTRGDEVSEETLANFTAQIVEVVIEDDGAEQTQFYKVEAVVAGVTREVTVAAESFASLAWVTEQLGPRAILSPGFGTRDRMRAAIQSLSAAEIPERRVYRHLGWIRHGGRYLYLHAGGAIGPEGVVPEISVRLDAPLDRYVLPAPEEGDAVREAVRGSLGLLGGLAPDPFVFPMFSLVWTTPITPMRESVHATGKTGERKTEQAALIQRHYGDGMDAGNLPGSWSSTGNSLEMTAFLAKDALFVVDDYIPTGSGADVQKQNREADRFLRAQANASARGRLRSDGTPRPPKPPRGSVLSTGEDIPAGHSLRARLIVCEIEAGATNLARLTQLQNAGPVYSRAMASYLRWCAGQLDELRASLKAQVPELRDYLLSRVPHGRTATAGATLLLGFSIFLRFAREIDAIDDQQARSLAERAQAAILAVLSEQRAHQAASDPAHLFVQHVGAALQAGDAHLVDQEDGGRPKDEDRARASGWRAPDVLGGAWRSSGTEIGWINVEKDAVYLNPTPAYRAAQRQGDGSPTRIGIGERTLWRRLAEAGLLASTEPDRNTAKVRIGKRTVNALHLSLARLFGEAGTSGTTPTDDPAGPADGDLFPILVPDLREGSGTENGNTNPSPTAGGPPAETIPDVPVVPDPEAGEGEAVSSVEGSGDRDPERSSETDEVLGGASPRADSDWWLPAERVADAPAATDRDWGVL